MCNLLYHLRWNSLHVHSNNSASIRYSRLSIQYTHVVTILPVLRLPKSASNRKLTLLTLILQIVSHFDLHRSTPMQLENQPVQSKMVNDCY